MDFRLAQETKEGGSRQDKENFEKAREQCRKCGNYNCSDWCKRVLKIFNGMEEED